ncbi:MAG TPA: hypothetical protein VK280_05190 [Streptosporangiaceae bacterium]|nr:hypothetical protein [Streptosporangiaceae bacterium]
MKTRRSILSAVAGYLVELGALAALLAVSLSAVRGFPITVAAAAVAVIAHLGVLRPRLVRWGATDEEVARPMPCDNIASPGARSTTRAVTIGVPAGQVWPWLAQLGYGRAGWYRDRLPDVGRQRGTAQIRPEWQQLGLGDRILTIARFRFGRRGCRRWTLLRRAQPARGNVLVPRGEAARSAQLPAHQPVARQVAGHRGRCPVDRAA